MSRHREHGRASSLVEVLAVVATIAVALAVTVPVVAGGKKSADIQQSMDNLATLGVAHVLYAIDWGGRQVTAVADDLGVFDGNVGIYEDHPPLIAGWGCGGQLWAYWPQIGNNVMFQPINFPGPPNDSDGVSGWGSFRITASRPLHDYVNGRHHDPVFYAPRDTALLAGMEVCLESPCEFVELNECNPGWSSYAMSPAAMFHPDVMRSNAAGGFQGAWELDHGYESPGLFQATYADLKTLMIEHSWLQNRPAECNPAFFGCEPYYFNMGLASSPVTLFYDTSVRLLPNTDVLAADQSVLDGTGGVDGLWHRGTPFADGGYFIESGFDGVELSHHVLTTDGILGRDTLADIPISARRAARRVRVAPAKTPNDGPVANPPSNSLDRYTTSQVAQ